MDMKILIYICAVSIIDQATVGDECNKYRKPNMLNRVWFYYCVNLPIPTVNYTWIPVRCKQGMVFHPVFKMCIIPDESAVSGSHKSSPKFKDVNISNRNISSPIRSHQDKISDEKQRKEEEFVDYILRKQNLNLSMNYVQDLRLNFLMKHRLENNVNETYNNFLSSQTNGNINVPKIDQISAPEIKEIKAKANETKTNQLHTVILTFPSKVFADEITESKTQENNENVLYNRPAIGINYNSVKLKKDFKELNEDMLVQRSQNSFVRMADYKELIQPFLTGGSLAILPCTTGLRMPNVTDCTKYYICNITSGVLHRYQCPNKMSFNKQKGLCDAETYNLCQKSKLDINTTVVSNSMLPTTSTLDTPITGKEPFSCRAHGKFPDPYSSLYYYMCSKHIKTGKIKVSKLPCLKGLEYCQKLKVCTLKQKCFI